MSDYLVDRETLVSIADAIRKINNSDKTYSPSEMVEAVTNIMDSVVYILVDEEGNEIPAVYVDSEVALTATADDIRAGCTAATDAGIIVGKM